LTGIPIAMREVPVMFRRCCRLLLPILPID
jgi:hypothetical protein